MHKVNDLKTALMIKEISKEGEPAKGLRRATVACSSCWPALATIGAISIFAEMLTPGVFISEGFCVGLLARSAGS
jgi:hypothetical protein